MSFVPLNDPVDGTAGPDRWYLVRRAELLTTAEGSTPTGALPAGETDVGPLFLGLLDGAPCWAVGIAERDGDGADAAVAGDGPEGHGADGGLWVPLMALGATLSPAEWTAAGRAVQLVEWARTSRYCGRCGTPTEMAPGERAVRCPNCGLLAYPRLAPAVIVLIRRGDEVLLARNGRFGRRMFSTVAGFVEPGETLEDAVRREVLEEVGVELGDVRYVGSQPWPFPHSLMLGFDADWASGDIRVDGEEIVEAAWFGRDSLPPIPPPLSIARRLIDRWYDAEPKVAG
jgi:NAD+ diphosphatase